MASIINAATSGGLVTTADTSGILQLQTAGTTAVTVDASQNVGVGVTPSGNFLLQAGNTTTNAQRSFRLMSLYGGISGGGYPQFGYNFRATTTTSSYLYDLSDTASAIEFQDGFLFKIAASGTAGNAITFTQALALEKDKSLALQGATPASGTGITFPATQSASSDANTLDDYEEGTWTPNMTAFINVTGTPTFQSAKYTKIGNKCFFEAGISGLSVTTANIRTSFQVDYPVTAVSAYAVSGTAVSNNASGLGGFLATSTTTSAIYWETGTIIPSGGQAFQIGAWITTA